MPGEFDLVIEINWGKDAFDQVISVRPLPDESKSKIHLCGSPKREPARTLTLTPFDHRVLSTKRMRSS